MIEVNVEEAERSAKARCSPAWTTPRREPPWTLAQAQAEAARRGLHENEVQLDQLQPVHATVISPVILG